MIDVSLLESSTVPWYRRLWQAVWNFLVGRHGFNLEKKSLNRIGVLLLLVAAASAWLTVKVLSTWAVLRPDPDSPAWELALQARLLLFRGKVALGLALTALGLAWLVFLVLDRTRLGKRLWHWDPGMDSEPSCAAKTLVAGGIFATLLLVFGLIAAQVLK